MKNLFKKIITDFHEGFSVNPVKRDLEINLYSKLNKIITIYGPRRAGKTYFLFYQIKELINSKGFSINDFIYINFEDNRLIDLKTKNLDLITDAYYELYPERKPFLFFDEIQNVEGWSKWLRRMNDNGYKIFVTGSNSRLLSKEIASELRGRTFSYRLLPFSVNEYLKFKGIEIEKNDRYSTRKISSINNHIEQYIKLGGFPEVLLSTEFERSYLLNEYINTMLYHDIIERYSIKNIYVIRFLINFILENYGSYFSVNKIHNFLNSQNIKAGKDILYEYFQHLQDSQFVFQIEKKTNSAKKSVNTFRKIYLSDVGYAHAGKSGLNYGRAFENVVFLELLRKGSDISLYKNDFECDFLINTKKSVIPVQVCYKTKESIDTYEREVKSLQSTMKKFKLRKGYIITLNESESLTLNKTKIKILSLADFLFFENL